MCIRDRYVDTGKWKARQGGNGLASASDVKIRFTNCTAEDHAKICLLYTSQAMLTIKKKFGKNAILKGMNLSEGATAKDRNEQIGGHKA